MNLVTSRSLLAAAAVGAMLWGPSAMADDPNMRDALAGNKGKRVTVLLAAGQELTGTVSEFGSGTVKLTELSGKEYFDATVRIDRIEALIVRARSN
jgi:TRAP-type mannitol/chloroaromatic compound transport system substrate-binding protein